MFNERWIPKDSTPVTRDGINGIVYTSSFLSMKGEQRYSAIGYRGKSTHMAFNYSFRSLEQMNTYIDEFFKSVQGHQERITQRRTERKEFKTALKPGDILHTSWGYDQTNVEFFQVLEVSKNTIQIREIGQDYKELGYMQGQTKPVKDQFLKDEPVLTRRVGPGEYVRIDDVRSAWVLDREMCFTSSYA